MTLLEVDFRCLYYQRTLARVNVYTSDFYSNPDEMHRPTLVGGPLMLSLKKFHLLNLAQVPVPLTESASKKQKDK